ncbi:MAG: class I SAM-dependent methyltransferase [Candidatus Obscuribacterales bacterium]|nr:class I SAM-dependent methyltransferase [Candidatus Obscuribacterales bacterium]
MKRYERSLNLGYKDFAQALLVYCQQKARRKIDFETFYNQMRTIPGEVEDDYGNLLEFTTKPNFPASSGMTATLYSIYNMESELFSIKISLLGVWINHIGEAKYLLTFNFFDHSKLCYLVRKEEQPLEDLLQSLHQTIPSCQIEPFRLKKLYRSQGPLFFNRTSWSANWDTQIHYDFYNGVSDPLMEQAFRDILVTKGYKQTPLMICDVGAGKGRLAEKLIGLAIDLDISINYLCIEPSLAQCKIARVHLANLVKPTISIKIFNASIEQFTDPNSQQYHQYSENIDIIISSGGVLNYQVVADESQALGNLLKLQELLKMGGMLLMTGLTPLLVTKKLIREETQLELLTVKFNELLHGGYCYSYRKSSELDLCLSEQQYIPNVDISPILF